jgi:hypothetical protein
MKEKPKANPGRESGRENVVIIYQSSDREGTTFALCPMSQQMLKERFVDQFLKLPRVFVAHGRYDEAGVREVMRRLHKPLGKYILGLLSGLDETRMAPLELEFRDPVTDYLVEP